MEEKERVLFFHYAHIVPRSWGLTMNADDIVVEKEKIIFLSTQFCSL